MKYIISLITFICLPLALSAQDWKALDTDGLFQLAREEAFDGKRSDAREKLIYILGKSPKYADVRILLARTYAWDEQRQKAIAELKTVLADEPINQDALSALIDVYNWDDNYKDALATADLALKTYPSAEEFLYKKAQTQKNLSRPEDALITLDQLLGVHPASERAIALRESLELESMKYAAGAYISYQTYSISAYDPAKYASLQLRRTNNWGASIIRANYSNRFGTSGMQGEIDLYPRIKPGMYGYLNYGFSKSTLFPAHRFGAELFSKLPKSFEGSLGARYLIFDSSTKVTIFTGSLGYYYHSFWFSFRPYITPDKNSGTSTSYQLTARRYFSSPETYITLTAGIGYSPENILQSTAGISADQIYVLNSQKIAVGFQKSLPKRWILIADVNFAHQELTFDIGNFMWIVTSQIGANYKF